MNYTLILLSGGVGSRMNQDVPKQYMILAGKPMIMHILDTVDKIESIKKTVIVCSDEYRSKIERMIDEYEIKTPVDYASAGGSRQASVLSGLKKVETQNVIIHEAARPFVTVEDFMELIDDPSENTMMGINIPFTVLKGHENVEGLLTRSELVNVQLPQKFNTKMILDAHKQAVAENREFTEDTSLLFYYNPEVKIKIVKGKDYNIKITTCIDILTGEIIFEEVFKHRGQES